MAKTRITFLRDFTRLVGNPITRLFAGHLPGFCIISYRGRKSGRSLSTPMNVFNRNGAWIFALTYGSDVQWVKNVLAAGRCEIQTRGRVVHLDQPEIVVDPSRRLVPRLVAFFLGFIKVTEFLRMRATADGPSST